MARTVIEVPKKFGVGARRFVGYDPRKVDAERRWLESSVSMAPESILEFEDAAMVPLVRVAKGEFLGGVFAAGAYREEFVLRRGSGAAQKALVAPPAAFPTTFGPSFDSAWYGGVIFNHFGHFLVEGLAHLRSDELVRSELPILFFSPHVRKLTSYMVEVFEQIGIDVDRIHLVAGAPCRVGRLYLVEPYIAIRRKVLVTGMSFAGTLSEASDKVTYVSRSRLKRRRTVTGEERLEEMTLRCGGEVLYPEQVSVAKQLEQLSRSKVVVGAEGSAFHTLMLVGGSRKAIILCCGMPNRTYLLQDELLEGDTVYISAASSALAQKGDWQIDPALDLAEITREF